MGLRSLIRESLHQRRRGGAGQRVVVLGGGTGMRFGGGGTRFVGSPAFGQCFSAISVMVFAALCTVSATFWTSLTTSCALVAISPIFVSGNFISPRSKFLKSPIAPIEGIPCSAVGTAGLVTELNVS